MRRLVLLLLALPLLGGPACAGVIFVGSTSIPGTAEDKSGLKDVFPDGTPHNRLGGFGSAIAWTGRGNRYVLLSDSGPKGAVRYACRFHVFTIDVSHGQTPPIKAALVSTHLLTDEAGRQLVGDPAAFDTGLRFDPEGARVGKLGTLFISDEYGPAICEFSPEGKRLRSLKVPDHFRITAPAATAEREEPPHNARGRVPNRGFEGLALNPDGDRLHALLQSPLLQDGGRTGVNTRLLEIHIPTGQTRELVYPLDSPENGTHEVLSVNDRVFLVIERDGNASGEGGFKKIIRANFAKATDVSGIPALPPVGLPEGVVAAEKDPLIDLLDPRFGIAGDLAAARIEGLAFGPDFQDGRKLLLVTTDNDSNATTPTWIHAFAVDPAELIAPWPGPVNVAPARPRDEAVSPFMLPAMLGGVMLGCLVILLIAWRWVGGGRNRLASRRK